MSNGTVEIIRAVLRRLESPAPPVIARSAATKQSPAPGVGDCFVAALLAMTGGVSGQRENALAARNGVGAGVWKRSCGLLQKPTSVCLCAGSSGTARGLPKPAAQGASGA